MRIAISPRLAIKTRLSGCPCVSPTESILHRDLGSAGFLPCHKRGPRARHSTSMVSPASPTAHRAQGREGTHPRSSAGAPRRIAPAPLPERHLLVRYPNVNKRENFSLSLALCAGAKQAAGARLSAIGRPRGTETVVRARFLAG